MSIDLYYWQRAEQVVATDLESGGAIVESIWLMMSVALAKSRKAMKASVRRCGLQ